MSGQLAWIKSSHSDAHGTCVEWTPEHASGSNVFPVRGSKDTAWAAFVDGVREHARRR
ncbi:DUF397 domain-containing protein [Streptomyces sp. HNM0574]|uniref:DUF397 domain-containing protein n=1 Tax=Streptomyces sp. HNM0574 TaxID=2714954 RepID=UPI00146BDF57|nr:DUF397 domain-containing protein [Streptomyces sp. HNM0574]NLU70952.1 DUF397 domain-containing protein [Streptomyces sp. HNM0574]